MKKIKIIGLVILVFMCGCTRKYNIPLHYSLKDVQKIELVDTSCSNNSVLYTLDSKEMASFWEELSQLHTGKYFSDPATEFGNYAIRILYSNGYIDVIGMNICIYLDPHGNNVTGNNWFYVIDDKAFEELIFRYVSTN